MCFLPWRVGTYKLFASLDEVCGCVFASLCLVKNDSPGKNHREQKRNIISPYNQIYSTADDGNNPAFNVVNIA